MITGILQSVLAGWLWRRVQELAGWAAGLAPLYLALPAAHQELIRAILTGQGGGYSISAYIGFALYLFSQFQSFKATTVPQVVTTDGTKILPKPDSAAMASVERQAEAAPKRKTLWEQITGK